MPAMRKITQQEFESTPESGFKPNTKTVRSVLQFVKGDTFNDQYIMSATMSGKSLIRLVVAEYEDGENERVLFVDSSCVTDHWTW